MDQCDRRHSEASRAETQIDTVFLRNTIKAPCIVGRSIRKIESVFHPGTAPGGRIEKRDDTKWAMDCILYRATQDLGSDHLRLVRIVEIEEVVDSVVNRMPYLVGHAPL